MKLEGVAEIELTNVHTGEKERYVEKNMVTNALQYIAGLKTSGDSPVDYLIPLYSNGLGGVLIFSENITEDADIILPPGNVECIGYAGNTAYAGKDGRRGSKNISESEKIENGAKLVWDFATNQANGIIKCLSLTSATGGNCGLGSENGDAEIHTNFIPCGTVKSVSGGQYDGEYDWAATKANNIITITRYKRPSTKIFITYDYINRRGGESFTIDVSENVYISNSFQQDADNIYFCGIKWDGSGTDFELRIFSKTSKKVTKKTFRVANLNLYTWDYLIKYPYIYMMSITIYKINIENPTDIVEMRNASVQWSETCIAGNRIYTKGTIIDENDKVLKLKTQTLTSSGLNYAYYPIDKKGILYSNNSSSNAYLYSAYLATINNLATPVIKTADKTMKITYTIREKLE